MLVKPAKFFPFFKIEWAILPAVERVILIFSQLFHLNPYRACDQRFFFRFLFRTWEAVVHTEWHLNVLERPSKLTRLEAIKPSELSSLSMFTFQ